MNIENDKKWFIYINDHHEGPFSVGDIDTKKKSSQVTDESYVWCEGMNDWLMISEVPELSNELKKMGAAAAPQKASAAPKNPAAKSAPAPATSEPAPSSTRKAIATQKKSKLPLYLSLTIVILLVLAVGGLSALSRFAPESIHVKLRPALSQITEKVPALTPLFHLIPSLPDIQDDELKELENARAGAPEAGVKIAIALSQNDPNRPAFYVATNLPDQTKFDIFLVGNSETLLNKLQFSGIGTFMTSKGFGKSEVFLADGGQLIPKGEYQVVVAESPDQVESVKTAIAALPPLKPNGKFPPGIAPTAHFAVMKTYFLGGPHDETYLTRLKQFHEKIKQNADREFLELKQYSDTLNLQFSTLSTEFNKIYQARKVTPQMTSAWKKDAKTWTQINNQLDQTVQTWSKETIQNEFFYGKVYALVKSAYDSTKALFALENGFVNSPVDHATFDVQHGKALSETRDALELLRTKMDVITKAPKSPNGLPTREGL